MSEEQCRLNITKLPTLVRPVTEKIASLSFVVCNLLLKTELAEEGIKHM